MVQLAVLQSLPLLLGSRRFESPWRRPMTVGHKLLYFEFLSVLEGSKAHMTEVGSTTPAIPTDYPPQSSALWVEVLETVS